MKLSTFYTKSLRKVLKVFWPDKISNCKQENMATIIMKTTDVGSGLVMYSEEEMEPSLKQLSNRHHVAKRRGEGQ